MTEEQAPKKNYCNKCGNKLAAEDIHCPECGNKVADAVVGPVQEQDNPQKNEGDASQTSSASDRPKPNESVAGDDSLDPGGVNKEPRYIAGNIVKGWEPRHYAYAGMIALAVNIVGREFIFGETLSLS